MQCCSPTVEQEMAADDSPIVNEVFAKASELPTGAKKIFEVRGRKILVVNDDGKYLATNGLCSHYNFPLETGVYFNGKIRCPLHGACFNMKTGDIEDYPGFDSLHAYEVKKVGDDLVIHTTEKRLSSDRKTKKPLKVKICNDHPIIVVGSGPSAANFVEHARLNGLVTPITIVTEEFHPPYDRVLLSKAPSSTSERVVMRKDDYFKENGIQIQTHSKVTDIDTNRRFITVATSSGERRQLPYSKLVLAVGGEVRKLTVPGSDLGNIHYLRRLEEANEISKSSPGKHVAIVGASFIGMEIASSIYKEAASVTVIANGEEPLPVFGVDVGRGIRKRFEDKGIKFALNASVVSLEGANGKVAEVRLGNGETIQADMVIAGIGVFPPTDFISSAGIRTDKRGFILVDKNFRTNVDFVFAIGDSVSAPLPLWDIETINIQHWQTAQTHGQLLGYSIVGKPHPTPIVPFFWSLFFFEFGVRFAGCSDGHDEIITKGDVEGLNFVRYYLKNNRVVAVCTAGQMLTAIQFLEIFKRDIAVTRNDVEKNQDHDWISLIN
ncbi:hypothetical protein WR25_14845 [Diploscapter pachys]|uniref:Rieske domain-containing protein n=1 Tax=Diploscapter pachys TaxID=2018661 RepID=A0A2A2KN17_9BILA|nr:hypothetical protein WR25_14845 [Diploscapter pachys]